MKMAGELKLKSRAIWTTRTLHLAKNEDEEKTSIISDTSSALEKIYASRRQLLIRVSMLFLTKKTNCWYRRLVRNLKNYITATNASRSLQFADSKLRRENSCRVVSSIPNRSKKLEDTHHSKTVDAYQHHILQRWCPTLCFHYLQTSVK